MKKHKFIREQRMTIVHGILAIVLIIVILQLWLFTATMEAYLSGDHAILLPAAVASGICLALNVGLMWYIYQLD
ncbi:hypothetical protein L0244_21180 [bacterium]|nr:hypothetical protein [bacterium]MCI0615511.1 hypothetical protein [bacterium]